MEGETAHRRSEPTKGVGGGEKMVPEEGVEPTRY